MGDAGKPDLYQRFEREVRTPGRRLLLDAFLPDPATLESAVTPPPPPPAPEMPDEFGALDRLRADAGSDPAAAAEAGAPKKRPRPKKKAKPEEPAAAAPRSLQDEIAEFMNRDRPALSPDDDLDSFLNAAIDPNADPPKDPDTKD